MVDEIDVAEIVLGPTDRLAAFGPMDSGKSTICRHFFRLYPLDRIVIDVNGDVDTASVFTEPFPVPLPEPGEKLSDDEYEDLWPKADGPRSYRYVPNYVDKNWRDEVDQVVGLAYQHRGVMTWFDEVGELIPVNSVKPWTSAALHLGRHRRMPQLYAGPRFANVDLLVKQQSLWIIVMGRMDLEDLERLAKTFRISVDELIGLLDNLEEHGFLAWHRPSGVLYLCPALEHPL